MTNNITLAPRPHHPTVTNIEALFLGQINPAPLVIEKTVPNFKHLIDQWLMVSCACFLFSFIIDFILLN